MTIGSNKFAEILGLREWPFGVVPDPDTTLIWAGRRELLSQLTRTIRRVTGSPQSTLHLIWADFGAGKTHALLFLRQTLLSNTTEVFPVYTVLPKQIRAFIDVYRSIVSNLTVEDLTRTYLNYVKGSSSTSPSLLLGDKFSSILSVLKALSVGSEAVQDTARRWIYADQSLTRKETTQASLPDKIRTTDDAITAISSLARLFSYSNSRVLLMIDEFQRTGELRKSIKNEIQISLRTLFNNCPKGLSIVLSFKFGNAREVETYLTEELRDLTDQQVFMIPVFDQKLAEEFLNDLIDQMKLPGDRRIERNVIQMLIKCISMIGPLKPRLITKTASLLFSEAAMDLEDGEIDSLSVEYIADKFEQFRTTVSDIAAENED